MGMPGHIIVRFGNTVVNFYRHSGGATHTGTLLLQALAEAPSHKQRNHFHEGGYLVLMLAGMQSAMSLFKEQHNLSKLVDPVQHEFVMIPAASGEGCIYGLELRALENKDPYAPVEWEIRLAEDLEGYEVADEWLPSASVFTPEHFASYLLQELPSDPLYTGNPDAAASIRSALEGLPFFQRS